MAPVPIVQPLVWFPYYYPTGTNNPNTGTAPMRAYEPQPPGPPPTPMSSPAPYRPPEPDYYSNPNANDMAMAAYPQPPSGPPPSSMMPHHPQQQQHQGCYPYQNHAVAPTPPQQQRHRPSAPSVQLKIETRKGATFKYHGQDGSPITSMAMHIAFNMSR